MPHDTPPPSVEFPGALILAALCVVLVVLWWAVA